MMSEVIEAEQTTVLAVPIPTNEITGNVSGLEKWAANLTVTNQAEYDAAYETLKGVKSWKNRIVDFFSDSKQKAYSAWKSVVASEQSMTQRLDAVERKAKEAITKYTVEQERIRLLEERRLQAEADERARKEREKLAQEIERQRAVEEEQRKKAEAARLAAEQADAAERKRLLAEAEAAERKANAANVKAEAKTEQADAVVAPVVTVAPTVQAAKGASIRKMWKHEIIDMNAFMAFACESKRYDLLLPNEKVLAAYATAMKEQASIR